MNKVLKRLLALNLYKGSPLKYREANYTLNELEKRLTAEMKRLGEQQPSTSHVNFYVSK